MILGVRHAVDVDGNASISKSSHGISDLLLEHEGDDEERLLRETLDCPLFQGALQRTWAHQSFAEFLAAYFLSRDCVSLKKIPSPREDLLMTNLRGRFLKCFAGLRKRAPTS